MGLKTGFNTKAFLAAAIMTPDGRVKRGQPDGTVRYITWKEWENECCEKAKQKLSGLPEA